MGRYCSYLLPKQLHVNMSEDSEADEDDDAYSQLDGVKLYKEASSAAMDNDQEEMEAATAPKLSSSSIGGHEAHAQAHAQVSVLHGGECGGDSLRHVGLEGPGELRLLGEPGKLRLLEELGAGAEEPGELWTRTER